MIQRSVRAVAPCVTIGDHVRAAPRIAQIQVVAQALGVAAGLVLEGPRTPPTIMSRLPVDVADVVRAPSTRRERAAMKKRLRLHHLERIRLNEIVTEVALDGSIVRRSR